MLKYIQCLSSLPNIGVLVSLEHNIRKLIYNNYIVLYQVNYNLNSINVITIFHCKRDINIILKHIKKYL